MSVDQVPPGEMEAMRSHLADSMPDDKAVQGMSDEQVLSYMDTGGYPGGAEAFVADGRQFTEDPRYR